MAGKDADTSLDCSSGPRAPEPSRGPLDNLGDASADERARDRANENSRGTCAPGGMLVNRIRSSLNRLQSRRP